MALALPVTVRVEEAPGAGFGLKVGLASLGNPEVLNEMAPVNPGERVRETLKEVVLPLRTVWDPGLTDREQLPVRVMTSMLLAAPKQRVKSVGLPVITQPVGRVLPTHTLSCAPSAKPLRLMKMRRLLLEPKQRVKSVATSCTTQPEGGAWPEQTLNDVPGGSPLRFRSTSLLFDEPKQSVKSVATSLKTQPAGRTLLAQALTVAPVPRVNICSIVSMSLLVPPKRVKSVETWMITHPAGTGELEHCVCIA